MNLLQQTMYNEAKTTFYETEHFLELSKQMLFCFLAVDSFSFGMRWPCPHARVVVLSVTDYRFSLCQYPRSGELRTQKSRSHLVRMQSLNVLPFKPGVGQYIAIHATLTARDFFLAYFYFGSF